MGYPDGKRSGTDGSICKICWKGPNWPFNFQSTTKVVGKSQAHIQAHPGIPLSELLATYPDLAVDVVWTLLGTRRAFTDLSATLLMRHEHVTLYAQETQVPKVPQREPDALVAPLPDTPLAWDGRLWRIEGWGEMVQLRPEVGEILAMPRAEFEHLKRKTP